MRNAWPLVGPLPLFAERSRAIRLACFYVFAVLGLQSGRPTALAGCERPKARELRGPCPALHRRASP